MNKTIVIKHSPIILIWTFVAIEILGFICYSIIAALGNYNELYTRLPFPAILSYQMAKFILLFGAQLVITVYAFLRWHLETYTIQPGVISHQWGVFFKRNKTIPLGHDMSITLSSGPLGKILKYGTIRVQNRNSRTLLTLSNIPRPQRYVKIIEKNLDAGGAASGKNPSPDSTSLTNSTNSIDLTRLAQAPAERASSFTPAQDKSPQAEKLLAEDEHEQLEFKSSFRFDLRSYQVNHELEKSVMKTVAGFLNSNGGNLVIGVDDLRKPLGLKHDYKTLRRVNSDGFENHFTQIFNAMIGPEFRHLIQLRFPAVDGEEVCVIHVTPSARPIYLKIDDNEHFYVRTGNATTPLKMSEVEAYARSHWSR